MASRFTVEHTTTDEFGCEARVTVHVEGDDVNIRTAYLGNFTDYVISRTEAEAIQEVFNQIFK